MPAVPGNFAFPTDYTYCELLNQVIEEEPSSVSDPTPLGRTNRSGMHWLRRGSDRRGIESPANAEGEDLETLPKSPP